MKGMKKILAVGAGTALVAALAIGGTFALFSDTDSDVNVMTMGNVKITQNEQQRVEEEGNFTNELENFEQGKMLLPVTYHREAEADLVKIGDYELTLSDNENNYVDKIISVTNNSNIPAYVRTLVAVPTGGFDWEPTPVSANNCWLHWNIPTGYNNYWTLNTTPVLANVNGVNCYVWEFTHNNPVEAGKTTFPMVRGFYLDTKVSNDDAGYYMTYADGTTKRINNFQDASGNVDIVVISQAVQAKDFENATAALDEAFGDVTKENAEGWFGEVSAPALVENAEELATALAAGDDVALTKDIKTKELIMNNGATLNGNGKTIDASETPTSSDCAIWTTGGTIENLTLVGDNETTRGIGSGSSGDLELTEDLYINNVTIDSMLYAINGSGSSDANVYVTDSTIYGWCSYSGINSFNFSNCTLGMGNSSDGYLVVYGTTNFTDCKFDGVFDIGARADGDVVFAAGKTITFTNCTYNGVKVTADNFIEYFYYGPGDERDFGNLMRECTIIVDGVKVDNSAYTN